jgi:hypothetical protein
VKYGFERFVFNNSQGISGFGVLRSVIFLPMIEDNGGVSLLVMIAE